MFTEMITSLKNNVLPVPATISGRLNIALIKKEAVLQLPKNFRVADPKVNPRADHMIWAAVLLEDKELFDITTTILLTEFSMNDSATMSMANNKLIIKEILAKLLTIPTDELIKINITNQIKKISNFNMLP